MEESLSETDTAYSRERSPTVSDFIWPPAADPEAGEEANMCAVKSAWA